MVIITVTVIMVIGAVSSVTVVVVVAVSIMVVVIMMVIVVIVVVVVMVVVMVIIMVVIVAMVVMVIILMLVVFVVVFAQVGQCCRVVVQLLLQSVDLPLQQLLQRTGVRHGRVPLLQVFQSLFERLKHPLILFRRRGAVPRCVVLILHCCDGVQG